MHGEVFVLGIIAISIGGGVARQWIAARHGVPLENKWQRRERRWRERNGYPATDIDAERQVRLLSDENEKLVGKIGRLEERLAVLERIATDPAERTAREIEALRDR